MRRVGRGLKFGRTWVGFGRTPGCVPRRFRVRAGGQRTPGPWWMVAVPFVGWLTINRDRTVFGWDDPDTGGLS